MNNELLNSVSMQDVPFPSFSAGWTRPIMNYTGWGSTLCPIFVPGMYAQNNSSTPLYPANYAGSTTGSAIEPAYYADADGVVRRAAGAYVPSGATSPVGLPPASIQGYAAAPQTKAGTTPASNNKAAPFTQAQSRPLLLHRPFRTVAELGYVFRDLPWKNLDFFTPESGDAGLLDLFCINENSSPNGLVAGKVDLNTRQPPVLSAIVSGAYVDDPKVANTTVGSLSTTLSSAIASALTARTADTANYGPLQNISELIGKWVKQGPIAQPVGVNYSPVTSAVNAGIDLPSPYTDGKLSYLGFSGATTTNITTPENLADVFATGSLFSTNSLQTSMSQIQRFREAPIRALASVGQTRVWNLMIDVIAQTGRYPKSASSLNQFLVEGEQRYWIHLAIDRLTGQVIDRQVEAVKE